MRFELLRTKGDVSKVSASDLSAIARHSHAWQFCTIYTLKWIETGLACDECFAKAPYTDSSFTFAMHIGTNLDQDLSADVVFLFLEVYFRLHVNNAR